MSAAIVQQPVIAVVGAGGKTTYIFRKKDIFTAAGQKVLILTTTKMAWESFTIDASDSRCRDLVLASFVAQGWAMVGVPYLAPDGSKKAAALPNDLYAELCSLADVILVEADGARHHSVKVPNATDINLPDNTTDVKIIMGTWDIGRPAEEVVHRAELLPAIGYPVTALVSGEMIHHILTECYFPTIEKQIPQASVEVLYTSRNAALELLYTPHLAER